MLQVAVVHQEDRRREREDRADRERHRPRPCGRRRARLAARATWGVPPSFVASTFRVAVAEFCEPKWPGDSAYCSYTVATARRGASNGANPMLRPRGEPRLSR